MRGATALPRDPHRRRLPVWPPHPAGAIPGCGSRAGCCSLLGEPRAGRRDHRRSRGLDRLIETKRLTVRLPQGAVACAWGEWRLHRVNASHMPRNERGAAVLGRCGFQVEGFAPAFLLINGKWEAHVLTAIVNPAVNVFEP